MSSLPAQGYLSNATRTNAEMQTAVEGIRDFIAEMQGGGARTELTIATGAIVPPDGAGGGHHTIDTEGNAATDDLTTITTTNTPEGRLVRLFAENAARVVTLKHAAGGAGQMELENNADLALTDLDMWVEFQLRGTTWVETQRHIGHTSQAALTTLADADNLYVYDDSADLPKVITYASLKAQLADEGHAPNLESEQATTSGTSKTFLSIPSWARRLTVQFAGVSDSAGDNILIQLGDSGGLETTGYLGASASLADSAAVAVTDFTTGFGIRNGAAGAIIHGSVTITLEDAANNTWVAQGVLARSDSSGRLIMTSGSKSLSATLDRVSVLLSGAGSFDAGAINLLVE